MAAKYFVSDARMRIIVPVQALIDIAQDINDCIHYDEALDSSLLCFPLTMRWNIALGNL
jgi:hypothetical protein